MSEPVVTEADREKAIELLSWCQGESEADAIAEIAHELAVERAKAREPFLALADELDDEAQRRWVRTLEAREADDRDAAFGERGAGDALHDSADRIRRAAEESQ